MALASSDKNIQKPKKYRIHHKNSLKVNVNKTEFTVTSRGEAARKHTKSGITTVK